MSDIFMNHYMIKKLTKPNEENDNNHKYKEIVQARGKRKIYNLDRPFLHLFIELDHKPAEKHN